MVGAADCCQERVEVNEHVEGCEGMHYKRIKEVIDVQRSKLRQVDHLARFFFSAFPHALFSPTTPAHWQFISTLFHL